MRIVFLGPSTEYKKLLILCMARIISTDQSVKIFTNRHYSYDEERGNVYDFCKIEIHRFSEESQLSEDLGTNACDYALIDINRDLDAGSDTKIVSIIEPERIFSEWTIKQAEKFIHRHPYTDIYLIFANILEYCKINRSFLEKLYERALKDSSNITKGYELYFDEQNAAIFQESMYEEKLYLKKLAPVWKMQIVNILCDLTGIDMKSMKKKLKIAERMK